MPDETPATKILQTGEYILSDPVLLQGMQTMREIKTPGFATILVSQCIPITERLIYLLQERGIETIFAEQTMHEPETITTDSDETETAITGDASTESAPNDDVGTSCQTEPLNEIAISSKIKILLPNLILSKLKFTRKEQRYEIDKKVSFVSESGAACVGVSKNISKEAMLLVSENKCRVNENEYGEIIINHKGNTSAFPCSVIRIDRLCSEKYHIALKVHSQEARDLFCSLIVSSTKCYNCGSIDNLEQCPKCNGINTICTKCLIRDTACKSCRADEFLYESRKRS